MMTKRHFFRFHQFIGGHAGLFHFGNDLQDQLLGRVAFLWIDNGFAVWRRLAELIPAAELVVSELVTNAVRYAQSKISLRLVLEGGLFIEILDDSAALPRLRQAADDDERGRGLQVVSQIAQRWGTRRTGTGKVVWCELPLPSARHGEPIAERAQAGTAAAPASPASSASSARPGALNPA